MASKSPSQALTKRSLDTALMPPPPPTKRIKRPAKVLDEDDYTDALSHIIARDFFPGLLESESKQEYLDALDSRDQHWIAQAGRKLTDVMTPGPDGRRLRGRRGTGVTPMSTLNGRGGETPRAWQGDTPGSVVSTSTSASIQTTKPEVDTNMSLSAFQQKYTSEDNESFYKLLDKQNQKKSEKYAWMWAGNKIPAARQIAHRKRERLLAANKAAEETENEGKQLAIVEPADKRQAMPDTWKSKPDNNFMFEPQSIEDTTQTVAQKRQDESLAAPKAVVYDNTRIAPPSTAAADEDAIPPSPSFSAVRDAIAGRPRHSEASFNGASTPRVNGYAFVDDRDPSPPPTTRSDPLLFTNGDSTPNPFKLHESSKREALHHRMVDKVAKGKRAGTGKREGELRMTAQTPKFMSSPAMGRSKGALTPAGQVLRGKLGSGGKTPMGLWEGRSSTPQVKGKGTRLREGWTPKA